MHENYGKKIKEYRIQMGLSQVQVADALDVTPGYISNVENGRTAMSLRMLIYYAKIMGITLDSLVGSIEPNYHSNAINNELIKEISKLSDDQKEKLLSILRIINEH